MKSRKVLNVGGYNDFIKLPSEYDSFEAVLLDIDPRGSPDILCDARELKTLEPRQFDAVYCAHNLEHFHRHEVPIVLSGFMHVLKEGGFVHIRVPDMQELMRVVIEKNMDIDDIIYQSPLGPLMVLDFIYGFNEEIEKSGFEYYSHKTGFTTKSLTNALIKAGFSNIYGGAQAEHFETGALAFKGKPSPEILKILNLPAM